MRASKLYKHYYSPPTKWFYGNPFTCFEPHSVACLFFTAVDKRRTVLFDTRVSDRR